MKRNTKIILGVLAVGVTATAGYFIYKRMKKKKPNASKAELRERVIDKHALKRKLK